MGWRPSGTATLGPWKLPVGGIQAEWNLLAVFDRNSLMAFEDPIEGTASLGFTTCGFANNARIGRHRWRGTRGRDGAWKCRALSQRQSLATGVARFFVHRPLQPDVILPRIGVQGVAVGHVRVLQTSTGFSDPTNFETLPLDEGFTGVQVLDSETAWSFEAGFATQGQLSLFRNLSKAPSPSCTLDGSVVCERRRAMS